MPALPSGPVAGAAAARSSAASCDEANTGSTADADVDVIGWASAGVSRAAETGATVDCVATGALGGAATPGTAMSAASVSVVAAVAAPVVSLRGSGWLGSTSDTAAVSGTAAGST